MTFDLHSRVVRIGGPELAPGCGYRDILIHEMTEHEIAGLKQRAWHTALLGMVFGMFLGAAILWGSVADSIAQHCR